MATKRFSTTKTSPDIPPALPPVKADALAQERTLEALAAMGDGEVAYVKPFRAGELKHMFPQIAELHNQVELFALFSADGTPLVIADTRDAVISGAWNHNLGIAVVH